MHKPTPESLVEQNQWLQAELQQAQFAHQSDVKCAWQVIVQTEAQNQTDFCAMAAELEKRKAEFAEQQRLALEAHEKMLCDKQAENDAALRANQVAKNAAIHTEWVQSAQQKTVNDVKWAAWVQQLQADQAKKQKEVTDDFQHRIAELQQRLHVSHSPVQPGVLYQSQSSPSVLVHAPPPLLPSVQVPSVQRPPMFALMLRVLQPKGVHGAQSPHQLIPSNALPQAQVVDFEQQRKIAQSMLAQKTTEVA